MNIMFGGSFDPIHNGHVSLIVTVIERYHPEQFIIVPSSQRINKGPHTFSAEFRASLIHTATAGLPAPVRNVIHVSDFELNHHRPVYTYETVQALKPDTLLVGSDLDYTRWKYYHEIIRPSIKRVLVVPREGSPVSPRSQDETIIGFERCAVSSSRIIACLRKGQPIDGSVPASIARMIEQQFSEDLMFTPSLTEMYDVTTRS